jgi:hypothetical protein
MVEEGQARMEGRGRCGEDEKGRGVVVGFGRVGRGVEVKIERWRNGVFR